MARAKRDKQRRRPSSNESRKDALSPLAPSGLAAAPSRPRTLATAAVLAVVTLIAFAPSLGNKFVAFDDYEYVQDFPAYNPPTLGKIAEFWAKPYPDMYTPILWTVWGLLAYVARSDPSPGASAAAAYMSPAPYHAFNVAAHIAAAVMAYLVLRRLVRSDRAALLGAAVFALHPLQVEAVTWVSGMKTPLSGFFALWSTWHYLRFTELNDDPVPARRPRAWWHYGLATFAFLLAMITKPTVVVLPLVIAAIEWVLRKRSPLTLAVTLGPWLIAGFALAKLTAGAHDAGLTFTPALWQRPLIALDSLTFYLRKLVLPFPLLPDYSRQPAWLVGEAHRAWLWINAIVSTALLAATAYVVLLRRKAPWLGVSVVIFGLGVATTLGLISYSYQRYSTTADRYAYLSLFGVALAVAYVAHARRAAVIVACAAAVCAGLTFAQCLRWKDTETLFRYTMAHNPRSLAAHYAFVHEADRAHRYAEMSDYAERALRLNPGDDRMILPYAMGNYAIGNFAKAADGFRQVKSWDMPPEENPHEKLNAFGASLARTGHPAEAERMFQQAVSKKPDDPNGYFNLATLYAQQSRWGEAAEQLRVAVRLAPGSPDLSAMLKDMEARSRQ